MNTSCRDGVVFHEGWDEEASTAVDRPIVSHADVVYRLSQDAERLHDTDKATRHDLTPVVC